MNYRVSSRTWLRSPLLSVLGLGGLSSACLDPPALDLEGPTVVASSLAVDRVSRQGVLPWLDVEFSEPVDSSTVQPGFVGLVPWKRDGTCSATERCLAGICEADICWQDPLTATSWSKLARGLFEDGIGLELVRDDDSRVRLRPTAALEPYTVHSLVVGEGVRDLAGAPLSNELGLAAPWRAEFVTADANSSGPAPRLVWPRAGERNVPADLAYVEVSYGVRIVAPEQDDELVLRTAAGVALVARHPQWCPAIAEGTCRRWNLSEPLPEPSRVRVVKAHARDEHGQSSVPLVREAWFEVGGPDSDSGPPTLDAATVWTGERCLFVQASADAPSVLTMHVDEQVAVARGQGQLRAGVPLENVEPERMLAVQLRLEDLRGRQATREIQQPAGPSFADDLPRVAIVEVLDDPRGPEPYEEFVELLVLPGAQHQSTSLDGLWLADLPWAAVRDHVSTTGETVGDPFPAVTVSAGRRVLVVSERYQGGLEGDVGPDPQARLIRLDASLGDGGLKNAGESLTLYRADPLVLVSSYTPRVRPESGQSVVRVDASGCDVSGQFVVHPNGSASPGWDHESIEP